MKRITCHFAAGNVSKISIEVEDEYVDRLVCKLNNKSQYIQYQDSKTGKEMLINTVNVQIIEVESL